VTHDQLVEECARAAFESHVSLGNGGPSSWEPLPNVVKEFWRNSLRAVLAVVWRRAQEVTPKMVEATLAEPANFSDQRRRDYLTMLRAGPLNPGE